MPAASHNSLPGKRFAERSRVANGCLPKDRRETILASFGSSDSRVDLRLYGAYNFSLKALTRNLAVAARVTSSVGQKEVAEQPPTTPLAHR